MTPAGARSVCVPSLVPIGSEMEFSIRNIRTHRQTYIHTNRHSSLYIRYTSWLTRLRRMFRIENSIFEPIRTKLGTHTLRGGAGVIGYFSLSIDIDFIDFLQNLSYGAGSWHRGVSGHADYEYDIHFRNYRLPLSILSIFCKVRAGELGVGTGW